MRKLFSNLLTVGVATIVGLTMIFSVSIAQEGKIPITTSSDQALQNFKQGRDLFEKLRFPDSRSYFEKAVEADPNFAMGYLYLALTVPSAKEYFENIKKAKNAMSNATEAEQMWILGSEAGFIGDPAKQEQLYIKMVGMYPNDERARMLLGNFYFGQQQYDRAINEYDEVKKINPEFSQVYNQLGYSYRFLKQYDNAEKAFKKYIELIPDDPNPYDSYAEFLMKVGRYEESIAQYRNALKYDVTFAPSYIGIATDNNFLGRYDQAREAAQDLYENAVNDGQRRAAHFAMAASYVDEGNLDMAMAEIQKQMVLAKQIDDAANISGDLVNIGNLMLEKGDPESALADYKLAMDVVQESDLSEDLKKNNRLGFLFNEARVALDKGDFVKAKANQKEYAERKGL
jgi:tetratricopeptide (TPR) repeat protein